MIFPYFITYTRGEIIIATVGAAKLGNQKKRVLARRAYASADPTFAADQVVHTSDVQRRWKAAVESKLSDKDFLVMYSGKTPRAAILEYSKFVALWRKACEMEEQLLEVEATDRILRARASGKPLATLKELAEKAGFIIPE